MNIKPIIEDVNDLDRKEFLEVLENEMDDIFDMVETMETDNVNGFDISKIYWEELSYEISGNRFNQTSLDFVYDEYSDGLWHVDIHNTTDWRVFL